VVSTINGDANVPFYKELGNQGIKAEDIPVVAFSVGEEELAGLDTAAGRPPGRLELLPERRHAGQRRVHRNLASSSGRERVTNDPMEAHYIGFNMWVKAVEKAGTTDPDGHRRHRRSGDRT
jgi:urea transport system substrate-binding protein